MTEDQIEAGAIALHRSLWIEEFGDDSVPEFHSLDVTPGVRECMREHAADVLRAASEYRSPSADDRKATDTDV